MSSLPRTRRRRAAVLATAGSVAALLLAAPVAPAATINACQKKKGGTLRIITAKAKCKRTEKKLTWSQAGPAGTNGTNGTNGERGPSDGWYTENYNLNVDAKSISLSLPAGTYAITGSMWAIAGSEASPAGTGNTVAGVDCPVSSPADTVRLGRTYLSVSGVAGDRFAYGAGTADVIVVLPVASTVTMTCTKTVGISVNLGQARLQAIALGKLNS